MKFKLLLLIICICMTVLFPSCKAKPQKITIGLVPASNSVNLLDSFKPISEYLEKEMKISIEVVIPKDYSELIDDLKNKKIDIGRFGPFSYVVAENETEVQPLVIECSKDLSSTSYKSIIIVRADSNLTTIEDLNGKNFAFVDPASTSGFIYPLALFKSRSIDVDHYFNKTYFSGNHESVVADVLNKKTDAGAVSESTFRRLLALGVFQKNDFSIIWRSEEIPNSPFVARTDLDKKLQKKFIEAMLSINEKAPEAVKAYDANISRYEEFDKNLYNSVRNTSNILGDAFIKENFLK